MPSYWEAAKNRLISFCIPRLYHIIKNDLGFNLSENEFFAKELVILDNEDSGYDDNLLLQRQLFFLISLIRRPSMPKTLMKDYIRQASLS